MITVEESKSGVLTARYNNTYLHSSYSPVNEAQKHFNNFSSERISTVVLLEPCLNYTAKLIRRNIPGVKIISVYLFTEFSNRDIVSDFIYNSENPNENFKQFLMRCLSETDIEGFKLIEWPSSSRIFQSDINKIKNIILQHIRELHGNITTTSGFGKKLIRNFIKNFISTENFSSISEASSSFFIAGSGPGLSDSTTFLRNRRNDLILLALPSSLKFLYKEGLYPDLIITTDPGYYASVHLHRLNNLSLIYPFTSNIGTNHSNRNSVMINQGSYIETSVLGSDKRFISLQPNGTVGGSALLFSMLFSSAPVFLAGLDFSIIDILSHIRPHSFDSYIEQHVSRTDPVTNIYYKRNIASTYRINGNLRRTSKPFNAYRGWFESYSHYYGDRVFFIDYFEKPPGDFLNISTSKALEMSLPKKKLKFCSFNYFDKGVRKNKISLFINDEIKKINSCFDFFSNKNYHSHFPVEFFNDTLIPHSFLPELLELKRIFLYEDQDSFYSALYNLKKETLLFLESLKKYV